MTARAPGRGHRAGLGERRRAAAVSSVRGRRRSRDPRRPSRPLGPWPFPIARAVSPPRRRRRAHDLPRRRRRAAALARSAGSRWPPAVLARRGRGDRGRRAARPRRGHRARRLPLRARNSQTAFSRRGPGGLSPMIFPNTVMNTMAAVAAIAIGAKAPSVTVNQATVAGDLAIARGAALIAERPRGRRDRRRGGRDLLRRLSRTLPRWARSRRWRAARAEGCRPYAADHNGPVLGEGATFVVLEEREAARARGATAYGRDLRRGVGSIPVAPHTAPAARRDAPRPCARRSSRRASRQTRSDGPTAPAMATPRSTTGSSRLLRSRRHTRSGVARSALRPARRPRRAARAAAGTLAVRADGAGPRSCMDRPRRLPDGHGDRAGGVSDHVIGHPGLRRGRHHRGPGGAGPLIRPVVVVDDGSADGSAAAAAAAGRRRPAHGADDAARARRCALASPRRAARGAQRWSPSTATASTIPTTFRVCSRHPTPTLAPSSSASRLADGGAGMEPARLNALRVASFFINWQSGMRMRRHAVGLSRLSARRSSRRCARAEAASSSRPRCWSRAAAAGFADPRGAGRGRPGRAEAEPLSSAARRHRGDGLSHVAAASGAGRADAASRARPRW